MASIRNRLKQIDLLSGLIRGVLGTGLGLLIASRFRHTLRTKQSTSARYRADAGYF